MGARTLRLAEISWASIGPSFEHALHRRVVGRKEISVYELADTVGVHPKTVEGWLYAGTEPKATAMRKLCLYFGPDFEGEVFGHIKAVEAKAAVSLAIADVAEVRSAAAALVSRLDGVLGGKSGEIVPMRSRA